LNKAQQARVVACAPRRDDRLRLQPSASSSRHDDSVKRHPIGRALLSTDGDHAPATHSLQQKGRQVRLIAQNSQSFVNDYGALAAFGRTPSLCLSR
jgi:hypothetical protein